jgi:hypothetical protein
LIPLGAWSTLVAASGGAVLLAAFAGFGHFVVIGASIAFGLAFCLLPACRPEFSGFPASTSRREPRVVQWIWSDYTEFV